MKIAVCEGDGIGHEVIPEAAKVLELFLPDADYFDVSLGYDKWKDTGCSCSDEDIGLLKSSDAILFGAVTTPPNQNYRSVLLTVRHELDLYANLRPVIGDSFDIMIVRENTEGLYSGIEEAVAERATTLRVITRNGSERIAKAACTIFAERGDKKPLVIGNKANVLKSDVLFRDTCINVAESLSVPYRTAYIDALTLDVLMHPENYGVIVTTNMFGDILSDACGYLTGGLGMLPSANIGEKYALFEPVHGSAPDIAGKGVANPVATIRSAAMMLEHFGMKKEALITEKCIKKVIISGVCTPDLGGNANTRQFADKIYECIKEKISSDSIKPYNR
ncbi:methanogen homoisocitrate dehydrogenase [Methanomicrobium sp. W14]|uniref:isocitrate/isopropylmalate dehydrogenase family protein n=1 Tax=Methanomicrobium sp. W14 TaxID=2817839 RepID=UPI001AE41D17|nr:isocitrate/isopropylmalate dehydrogenase family protein [Methanomicrobium sp. W14]MBP2134079.1 methanogen homoisocitrate dehydrogenase [Methanomicrobium sp. W14]